MSARSTWWFPPETFRRSCSPPHPCPGSVAPMPAGTLFITGDKQADALLNRDGTALLIGMLLDQQVPMEWAFAGPATLKQRLGHLDAKKIAAMDVEDFVAVCCEKPAIHRFPASMGRRIHELCVLLTDRYGGKGANVWKGVESGDELYRRLRELPGYGEEKSKIFVAILGKRMSVEPTDWRPPQGSSATTCRVRWPTSTGRSRSGRCGNGRRRRRQPRRTSRGEPRPPDRRCAVRHRRGRRPVADTMRSGSPAATSSTSTPTHTPDRTWRSPNGPFADGACPCSTNGSSVECRISAIHRQLRSTPFSC